MDQNKYKYWMVTILSNKNNEKDFWLPREDDVYTVLSELCEKFVFQQEKNENSKDEGTTHYQCCLTTKIRIRKSTLLGRLSAFLEHPVEAIRADRMRGSWNQGIEYCSKPDTKVGRTVFSPGLSEKEYTRTDIDFLSDPDRRYPWQKEILDKIFDKVPTNFKDPHDREVHWITDFEGNSGKSKLTKYLCAYNNNIIKISFGTANQLRSAVVSAGSRKMYIIDIPRTLGSDDSLTSVISVVEDIKGGFISSSFYGTHNQLLMTPPHVVIFSNRECPAQTLSSDRWQHWFIYNKELHKSKVTGFIPSKEYKEEL